MVVREFYKTRADGVDLYRTYSDTGMVLVQNETGTQYDEAIDVDGSPFTYSETDIPVDDGGEATTDDLYNALSEMGVDVL